MYALRIEKFGGPEVIQFVELDQPVTSTDEALVRVHATSVNPSDVKNVAGFFDYVTKCPITPGRDFSGVVVAGPAEWVGAEVWGAGGGDLGFTVNGAHSQYIVVPVAALQRKPKNLSHEQAAAIGVNWVIAHLGAIDYAKLQPGEAIAVVGASGGVGGAVSQIAKSMGCRVVAFDRTPPSAESAVAKLADAFIQVEEGNDLAKALREANNGELADVVFDGVGGVLFERALGLVRRRGRMVNISATGRRRVEFDLPDFYHNETQLMGADSGKLDIVACGKQLVALVEGFESGTFVPPKIAEIHPLSDAPTAYKKVIEGTAGRVVLKP